MIVGLEVSCCTVEYRPAVCSGFVSCCLGLASVTGVERGSTDVVNSMVTWNGFKSLALSQKNDTGGERRPKCAETDVDSIRVGRRGPKPGAKSHTRGRGQDGYCACSLFYCSGRLYFLIRYLRICGLVQQAAMQPQEQLASL